MKTINKLFKGAFCAASIVLACSSSAKDWWFDVSMYLANPKSVNWSDSGGTADTDGYWKDADGNHSRGELPGVGDSIYITGEDMPYKSEMIIANKELTLANIFLGGAVGKNDNVAYFKAASFGTKLNITGNIERMAGAGSGYLYGFALEVQQNVIVRNNGSFSFGRGSGNPLHSILIHGNLEGLNASGNPAVGNVYLTANGLTKARAVADRTFENGLKAPDTVIEGLVKDIKLYMMADNVDSYLKVNGITGGGSIQREGNNSFLNTTSNIILANTADQSASGDVTDKGGSLWKPEFGKTVYVMNGSATQSMTSTGLGFHGGVKVLAGTLRMNFKQNGYSGTYTYNSAFTNSSNKTVVRAWTDKDGAGSVTAWSHGDLEVLGGTFGSTAGADFGSFRFTNIIYSSGKISLKMKSATEFDSIDLTGYYLKNEVYTDGIITGTTYDFVEGGTLSKLDGAGKVTFDFGDNLDWLIDAQNDGVKVIAWDAGKKSTLTAADFAANTFTDGEGNIYGALFAVNDDGLYVKYVAVPEPATIAALFGVLALGLAAWRRRK